jgi:3-oxoacyl-[acyl-carrier-protein] synthase-3
MPTFARILDIAGHFPERTLANEELEAIFPGWTAAKIYDKTGIRSRRIAAADETAGDLAYGAAQALFARGAVRPEDVDFVILCTQAPDYLLPTTACVLQDRLSIPRTCGALDVNLGCSGFVYCLSLAKGMIESGSAKCVLILTADTYSKYIHPLDKSVRTLFGDGAAATAVIAHEAPSASIGPFVFGTDGSGAADLIVKSGGARTPRSAETAVESGDASGNVRSDDNLFMDGAEVMSFSLREVPRAAAKLLDKAQLEKDEIDYFVLHQANRFMLEALRKKLAVCEAQFPIHIENCGNTVSSTIPLALAAMRDSGCFEREKKVMLVGFGVGYSWAAGMVNIG